MKSSKKVNPGEDLDDIEVDVKFSESKRNKCFRLLLLIVLLDNVGALILMTGEPSMLGGQKAFPDQAFPSLPFSFSLSKALLFSTGSLGQLFSNLLLVPRADTWGRKPVLLIFMFGGALMFVAALFLGDPRYTGENAFWLYLTSKFFIGFFSGSSGVVTIMITDLYADPNQKVQKSTMVMPITLLAMTLGGLIGGIGISSTGTLLIGAYLGAGLSVLGGLIVIFKIPSISSDSEKGDKKNDADGKPGEKPLDNKVYHAILCAHTLDSVGTSGLTAALSLVLYERFSIFKERPEMVGISSTLLIFFIILGMGVSIPSLKKRGPGFNAVFGNFATLVAQIILVFIWHWVPYLAACYIGYSASFFSTVAYMPMIITIAPPSRKAQMQASYGAIKAAVAAALPIGVAAIVSSASGSAALLFCASFSLLGTLASLPLYRRFGAPPPSSGLSPEEKATLKELGHWDLGELLDENQRRREAGQPEQRLTWGSFEADLPHLELLHKVARYDFAGGRRRLAQVYAVQKKGGVEAEKIEKDWKAMYDSYAMRFRNGEYDEEALLMGKWLASYLDHANHYNWMRDPTLAKTFFMTMFPPLPRVLEVEGGTTLKEALPAYAAWSDKYIKLEKDTSHVVFSAVGSQNSLGKAL